MIIVPTKKRLERRRDALYKHLHSIMQYASIHQVEDIMRKIHGINLKLKTYFQRDNYEPEEIFEDYEATKTEDNVKGKDEV